jgi:hypothetical protein
MKSERSLEIYVKRRIIICKDEGIVRTIKKFIECNDKFKVQV